LKVGLALGHLKPKGAVVELRPGALKGSMDTFDAVELYFPEWLMAEKRRREVDRDSAAPARR
jgi:hypothetical protein